MTERSSFLSRLRNRFRTSWLNTSLLSTELWSGYLFGIPAPQPAALDLDVTGNVQLTSDRTALIFDVLSGTERHLDADCQHIRIRPASRNRYTVRFSNDQLHQINSSPTVRDVLTNLHGSKVNGRLYICDGRVEQATLVTSDGSEIEWLAVPSPR